MIRRGGGFTTFCITGDDGSTRLVGTCGRYAQALRALIVAGPDGITSMTVAQTWGLRLSEYIRVLRHDHGLRIATEYVEHDGPFAGRHGKYVLLDRVRILDGAEIASRVAERHAADGPGIAA